MSISIKFNKQFTEVPIPGGGVILVRAEGREFEKKRDARVQSLKALKGVADSALTTIDIIRQADKLIPTQLIDLLILSHDSPFSEDSREKLAGFSYSVLLTLALHFSCCSVEEYNRLSTEEAIGETFLGFRDFVDTDNNPIPDRNPDGTFNKENCMAVLDIDEVWAEFITAKNRLTAQRTQRWTDAAKNLPLPAAGRQSGAVN